MSDKIPPTCAKCELQHWHFQPCEKGKKYVRVGYDSIKREHDYQRLQYRNRPRIHYKEQHREG